MGSLLQGSDLDSSYLYSATSERSYYSDSLSLDSGTWKLPQETDDGCVEYKQRLTNVSPERIQHLVTQLRWRLSEGHGSCIYELGVADDGQLTGLPSAELEESVATLRTMCAQADAEVCRVRRHELVNIRSFAGDEPKRGRGRYNGGRQLPGKQARPLWVAECVVRKMVSSHKNEADGTSGVFKDVRIAVVGCADAGKSTLLGVLSHGEPDNARGRARLSLLRHPHELVTGRTSSLSHQLIGFTTEGTLNNYRTVRTWENIVERSAKVVELLDTCGHARYIRTTVSALSGRKPDFACLVVPVKRRHADDATDREIVEICDLLGIPFFVIASKSDTLGPDVVTGSHNRSATVDSVLAAISDIAGSHRNLKRISGAEEAHAAASEFGSGKSVPVFLTSSVTGEGLETLLQFFKDLRKPADVASNAAASTTSGHGQEFGLQVEEVFNPPDVGLVVSGVVFHGRLRLQDQEKGLLAHWLGPVDNQGSFVRVKVNSIHRQRVPVGNVGRGDAASFAVEQIAIVDSPVVADTREMIAKMPRLGDNETEILRKKQEREQRKEQMRRNTNVGLFGPEGESDSDGDNDGDEEYCGTPTMFSFDTDVDDSLVPDVARYRRSPTAEWVDSPPTSPLAVTAGSSWTVVEAGTIDRRSAAKRPLGSLGSLEEGTVRQFGSNRTPSPSTDFRPRKGQVLLSLPLLATAPRATREFEADIQVISLPTLSASHSTLSPVTSSPLTDGTPQISHVGVTIGSSGTVHIGSVRQSATIIDMHVPETETEEHRKKIPVGACAPVPVALADRILYLGERARAKFRFMNEPEWVREGWIVVFRHGKTLIRGTVVKMV